MMGNARDRKEGSYCFNCKFWRGGDTPMEPDGTPAEGWCGFTLADGAQLYHDTLGVTKSNNWCCLWMARKDGNHMNETEETTPGGLPECPYQIGKLAYMSQSATPYRLASEMAKGVKDCRCPM